MEATQHQTYQNWLKDDIDEARLASDVVQVLCSWPRTPSAGKPGISKALYLVRRSSKTIAKEHWGRHAKYSILIHLLLKKHPKLTPHMIATDQFAKRLLDQTRDIGQLTAMIAAHNSIVRILPPLDEEQISRKLWLADIDLPDSELAYDPDPLRMS